MVNASRAASNGNARETQVQCGRPRFWSKILERAVRRRVLHAASDNLHTPQSGLCWTVQRSERIPLVFTSGLSLLRVARVVRRDDGQRLTSVRAIRIESSTSRRIVPRIHRVLEDAGASAAWCEVHLHRRNSRDCSVDTRGRFVLDDVASDTAGAQLRNTAASRLRRCSRYTEEARAAPSPRRPAMFRKHVGTLANTA